MLFVFVACVFCVVCYVVVFCCVCCVARIIFGVGVLFGFVRCCIKFGLCVCLCVCYLFVLRFVCLRVLCCWFFVACVFGACSF